MNINCNHKEISKKKCEENIKELHKKYPDFFMSQKEYSKLKKKYMEDE